MRLAPRPRVIGVASIAVVTVSLALAACSSSSASPNTSGGSASVATTSAQKKCVAEVSAAVAPYRTLPTSLPAALTPLAAKPKAGTIIKLVNGQISGDIQAGQALVQAATAAGWKSSTIVYNGSIQDMNAKWLQAVSEHPNAIIASGPPAAEVETSLAASKKAGIITDMLASTDTPGKGNDLTGVTLGTPAFQVEGVINAELMLADSGCSPSAQVLVDTLPFPALVVSQTAFDQTVAKYCPKCKIITKVLQTADLGTPAGTSSIVSAIQADPSIKYIYSVVGSNADGLPSALHAAGLSGVKIFGSVPDAQSLQGLQNQTEAWWVNQDATIGAWLQMDTVLRLAEAGGIASGKTMVENSQPIGILTPQNVSKTASELPNDPTNYAQLFKKLWHTG